MKLLEAIEKIPDPRMEGKVKHKLSSIIFMTLCAVLSGCECWNDIEDYCKTKKEWLLKINNKREYYKYRRSWIPKRDCKKDKRKRCALRIRAEKKSPQIT